MAEQRRQRQCVVFAGDAPGGEEAVALHGDAEAHMPRLRRQRAAAALASSDE